MEKNYNLTKTTGAVAPSKSFSSFMNTVGSKLVANTITDEKRKVQFIANIVSAVSNNPALQECDQVSVVSAALQAEAMHFPINNALGFCYLVPFKEKKWNPETRTRETVSVKAQFQIGYKGYIQLAIRSGQYKSINVVEVKEGELGAYDPLNGPQFNWINDYETRKNAKTIGYVAQIELINGFKQQMYMTYEAMMDHANTYSAAFTREEYETYTSGRYDKKDEWKYSSFWYKNFDEMAKKTMLRQILSKWGIMSIEMQEAYLSDQTATDENGNRDYIDAKKAFENVEQTQATMGTAEPVVEAVEPDTPDWF